MKTIKDRLARRSSELIVEEIKQTGLARVANEIAVFEKVKKYLGIELSIEENGILKFKNS